MVMKISSFGLSANLKLITLEVINFLVSVLSWLVLIWLHVIFMVASPLILFLQMDILNMFVKHLSLVHDHRLLHSI